MKSKKFGKESKITAAWAIAGFFVSSQIIPIGRFSLFGYPLLALSILLAILAIWQALRVVKIRKVYILIQI